MTTAWLLTWLWQGCALVASVGIVLRYAPRVNAATRHLLLIACLAAIVWLGWTSSPHHDPLFTLQNGRVPIYVPSAPDLLIAIVTSLWSAVTLLQLLRVLASVRGLHAMRRRCKPFPVDVECRLPMWLEAKARGRGCDLMICDAVPGATVLGFYKPCIALPPSVVQALTTDELDLVILHEHAHVQRRDDWWRLAQTLLLSVLWVHPAALFLARMLNRECEKACDEWAVARAGSPKAYARSLVRAAEVQAPLARMALVPALIGKRPELMQRVDHVLALHAQRPPTVSVAGVTAAICAMLTLSVQLQEIRFTEMVTAVFPSGAAQPAQQAQHAQRAPREQEVQRAHPVRRGQPTARVQALRPTRPAPPVPDLAPVSSVTGAFEIPVSAQNPVDSPVGLLPARSFEASYGPPISPSARGSESHRWHTLAAPGVEIARSARKSGAGLANAFSRAGMSFARSF